MFRPSVPVLMVLRTTSGGGGGEGGGGEGEADSFCKRQGSVYEQFGSSMRP